MQQFTNNSDYFLQLLDKYLLETITAEENSKFFELLELPAFQEMFKEHVGLSLAEALLLKQPEAGITVHVRERLNARIMADQEQPSSKIIRLWHAAWFRYAAAVILIAGVATAWLMSSNWQSGTDLSEKINPSDILPGRERAVLTLADGTTITLDSAGNGTIARQGNASIVKLANGEIRYDLKGLSQGDIMMNTMSTPRGGQYRLQLPDGSTVWLNAASSIMYPAAFVGNSRKVKVRGEVYMEVAQDKDKPFIVDVDGKTIVQVLGTRFNINSYEDDGHIKTTLVEGSIKVLNSTDSNQEAAGQGGKFGQPSQASGNNGSSVILKPGQQALQSVNPVAVTQKFEQQSKTSATDAKRHIIVASAVDVDQVLAWKNGYFSFNNTDLREVARQMERWYDIEVAFEGGIGAMSLTGEMDRGVSLSGIQRFLNQYGFQTILKGRKLIVSYK